MFSYLGVDYPNIMIVSKGGMPADIPSDAACCEYHQALRLEPYEALVKAALDDPAKPSSSSARTRSGQMTQRSRRLPLPTATSIRRTMMPT